MTSAEYSPSIHNTDLVLPVERIRVSVLSVPLEHPVPMSFGGLQSRQVCLVEINAGGLHGVGESWINYPPWAAPGRMAALVDGIAPQLLGMNAANPETVLEELSDVLLPIGRQAGALGAMWQALSGVDIALWDLSAKARGVSIADLLAQLSATPDSEAGAAPGQSPAAAREVPRRKAVPAYGSGVGPTDVTSCCQAALDQGLAAVKTKIGFGADKDAAILESARETIGDDHQLFADANQAWDLETALRILPLLATSQVRWLEEPLAGDGPAELDRLAASGSPQIATGENVYGFDEFARLVATPGIRILQPDLAKSGGFSIARRIAERANNSDTAIAPHCYSSAIGLAAAAQLGGAYSVVDWLELDIRTNPLRTDLLTQPLGLDDGAIQLPDAPGLGIELDPDAVKSFRTHEEEVTK